MKGPPSTAFHVGYDKTSLTSATFANVMQCGHSEANKIIMPCLQRIGATDVPVKTGEAATSW